MAYDFCLSTGVETKQNLPLSFPYLFGIQLTSSLLPTPTPIAGIPHPFLWPPQTFIGICSWSHSCNVTHVVIHPHKETLRLLILERHLLCLLFQQWPEKQPHFCNIFVSSDELGTPSFCPWCALEAMPAVFIQNP